MSSDSESNEEENKREGRTRNLLKNFYGIGDESSPGTDATSNLNTALFDANSYYKNLLRNEPLVELIQTDNKLVTDIRRLDSDMKTLVYENYSKFITATETIRKMRGNVETMEEEMNRLSTNMNQISNLTNNINDSLDFRRNQISKLSGVNHVITKFQFIIDLPLRLKKAIELNAFSQAVKYYKTTFPLLQKYQSLISSFKTISNETLNVIDSLKKILQNRIINSGESLHDVTESVQLLIELGDSAEDLRNQYLDLQNVKLQQKLEVAKKPNMSLTEMNKIFLDGFLEVSLSYNRLFIEPFQDEQSVSQLELFASSLFAKYFDFLTLQLSSNFNMNELFVQVENLYDSIDSIDTKLPTLNLTDKSEQILVNVVNKQYDLLFQQYYQSVKELIFHLEDPSHDQYYNSLITERATNILVGLQDVLEKCKGTILSGNKFIVKHKMEIIQLIISKSHHLLRFMSDIVKELLKTEVNKQSGVFLLLFAKLCLYLESEGFKQLQSIINKFVSSVDNHTSHYNTSIMYEVANPFKSSPTELVKLYIRTESEKLSAMIWKDREITDWWSTQEPSAPRVCIVNTVKIIYRLAGELNNIFEPPAQKSMRKSVSTLRSTPSLGSMFGRKFKMVADMEFTSVTILHSVVKMYLKSLLESVRPHTYNVSGFRQLQADTYLIRVSIASLLESSQEHSVSLHDLVDEVFHSVSERCVDPDTLDPEKLAKICENALATIKS